jgi:threonine dehydrogenase-like Zn-dependent dehydrogenase
VDRALDILAEGLLPGDAVITHHFGLDDYQEAVSTALARSRSQAIKVVFRP